MDDLAVDEEKKPFDELGGQNEDDSQPDPDEHIMLESGQGRVWLVKVRSLHDTTPLPTAHRPFPDPQVPHGTLVQVRRGRAYSSPRSGYTDVPPGAPPRIVVLVPSDDGDGDDIYELDMVNQDVHNQVVVAERAKAPTGTGRARTTIMTGKVKHECNLRPRMTGRYERRLAARGAAAKNEKAVRVGLMDWCARRGAAVGRCSAAASRPRLGFADLTRTKVKPQKGQYERMARMPRNQLLDSLFSLFREREQWPIKLLREKTQQPEVYLKEVLSEIATLHRSGEFNGTWELMPSFKGDGIKAEGMSQLYASQPSNADVSMDDYDEEEEDDDDMEEVME
ncbi:transcription initiation factor IIF, beta subunit-domain-containing protein [Lactarius deliciosus]|nr:transcription initiation factor IIF, beta subunit-domain-containing protein [Lactarius deliciosus]